MRRSAWSDSSCRQSGWPALPIPGQQLIKTVDIVIGDPGQHVGEPGLGIDLIELGRVDQHQHDRGALAATIGAGEQPRLASEGNSAQLENLGLPSTPLYPSSGLRNG